MLISAKGKYAIGLMLDLAENGNGEPVKLIDVAHRQGMSLKYLEQVSRILKVRGLIKSYRGTKGGYAIRQEPQKYTVGMILRVTEGDTLNIQGAADYITENTNGSEYIAKLICNHVIKIVNETVDNITLQDLIDWQEERKDHYII